MDTSLREGLLKPGEKPLLALPMTQLVQFPPPPTSPFWLQGQPQKGTVLGNISFLALLLSPTCPALRYPLVTITSKSNQLIIIKCLLCLRH